MTIDALQHEFLDHVINAKRPVAVHFATGASGLAIYRHAYRAQLVSCLRTGYDKSWSWMGDDRFDMAAAHHIDSHIPRSWSLDHYGRDFPSTLAALFPDDIEIAELAALEQAMQSAFVAADAVAAEMASLVEFMQNGNDLERLRLQFTPGFTTMTVSTNVAEIWQAMADESEMPSLAIFAQPHLICIWRKGATTHFRDIEGAEAQALADMTGGADFGDLCAMISGTADAEGAAATAGGWLARWIGDGMVLALV